VLCPWGKKHISELDGVDLLKLHILLRNLDFV
jgi:hypothetical protein